MIDSLLTEGFIKKFPAKELQLWQISFQISNLDRKNPDQLATFLFVKLCYLTFKLLTILGIFHIKWGESIFLGCKNYKLFQI